jgi:NAD(P)-dependent dehydrogenase (short-subunit alcohol dehydrogenase family)
MKMLLLGSHKQRWCHRTYRLYDVEGVSKNTFLFHTKSILIINVGVSSSASDYVRVFETNVVGTALVTQKLLPALQKKKERKIFNISSILGSVELTYAGANAPYGVSKAAENMYTKTLAEDLKSDNFTVLAIHPGWVQTDM